MVGLPINASYDHRGCFFLNKRQLIGLLKADIDVRFQCPISDWTSAFYKKIEILLYLDKCTSLMQNSLMKSEV
jgi:hypothetical protein